MVASRLCTCDNFVRGTPFNNEKDCQLCWDYWQQEPIHKSQGGKGCYIPAKRTIIDPCPTHLLSLAPPQKRQEGPGTELKLLLESLGIKETAGCNCNAKMQLMDEWGTEGCQLHFSEIVNWLREEKTKQGWGGFISAAVKAVSSRMILNPFDPITSLVDLAIQLAEEKGGV